MNLERKVKILKCVVHYLFHEFCVYIIIIITSINIISPFKLKYIDLKKKNIDSLSILSNYH